ncbi:helix-turn-helix domain-containing protein [Eubacterium sp. BSD2780061688b_171218_H5]|uniref:helix-turn-helix domain-containing protein n=1 Tax=Eubacterium sp. BSD2780061688b_171218_H5 TaxID=2787085 RepID=UPI00325FBDB9
MIYLSQEELADILAANRVNLSRNLSRLRQEGIIATGRKQIRILRPDLLVAHCSSETL